MEKKCKVCGNLFVSKCGAHQFCSYECRVASGKSQYVHPDEWVYHGECPQCGKHFESDRKQKYCSEECQCQFQLDRAKAERLKAKPLCQQCGKQLPLKRKTFCSDACQKLSEKKTDIVWAPLTDEIIRQRIAEHYDNIEHISGHKSDGKLTVRCKVCGGVFQMGERVTRKGNTNRLFPCPYCDKSKATEHPRVSTCAICGKSWTGGRATKCCSDECQIVYTKQRSLTYAQNKHLKKATGRICKYCGTLFIPEYKSGHKELCSDECVQKHKADAKKQRKHVGRVKKKNNGSFEYGITLDKLIKRDKNVCHICGGKCNRSDYIMDPSGNYIAGANHPSIDHVMPLSKGGSHTWGNIKLAHHRCNSLKSNNTCYEQSNGQMALAI